MKYSRCILENHEYDSWNQFAASCPSSSVYADTRYLKALSEVLECDFRVLAIKANGAFAGGIATLEYPTNLGLMVHPRLLLQYNGLVVGSGSSAYPSRVTSDQIGSTNTIASFIEEQDYARTIIRTRWPFDDVRAFMVRGWSATPTYTYLVSLSDLSGQWQKVTRDLRRLIRKCEREGVNVTRDDDFESFYRMHVETSARKGSPIYLSESQFSEYYRKLTDKGLARLYHARIGDGSSIASQLVLAGDHPVSETVSACADARYLKSGGNAFLRWKAFEDLAADGYTHNDLTDAELNPVTRFKSQFGGDLKVCFALKYPDSRRLRLKNRVGRVLDLLHWNRR